MDFNIVKRQIISEYIDLYGSDRKGDTWSLGSVLNVFRYFYWKYAMERRTGHPHLSNDTIRDIITRLPYIDDVPPIEASRSYELEPEEYEPLIDGYFLQDFENCNYSMAHFMSGEIRTLRFYEELY